jgi:hypothetical protein
MQHYMGASRNHVKPPVLAEKPPVPTTTIEGRSQSAPRHPSCGKSPQCRQRPSKVAARVRRGTPAMEKAPSANGDRRRSQPKCAAAPQPWKKPPVPTFPFTEKSTPWRPRASLSAKGKDQREKTKANHSPGRWYWYQGTSVCTRLSPSTSAMLRERGEEVGSWLKYKGG